MTVIDRRIKNKIKKSFNDQKKEKKKKEIKSIVKQAETHQKKKQK